MNTKARADFSATKNPFVIPKVFRPEESAFPCSLSPADQALETAESRRSI
jgi:hypothetical protein